MNIDQIIEKWEDQHRSVLSKYSKGHAVNEVMVMYRTQMKNILDFVDDLKTIKDKMAEQDVIINKHEALIVKLTLDQNNIKPEINTSKGSYVVALQNDYFIDVDGDYGDKGKKLQYLTKDQVYYFFEDTYIVDDLGDKIGAINNILFRQATESEIQQYKSNQQ